MTLTLTGASGPDGKPVRHLVAFTEVAVFPRDPYVFENATVGAITGTVYDAERWIPEVSQLNCFGLNWPE